MKSTMLEIETTLMSLYPRLSRPKTSRFENFFIETILNTSFQNKLLNLKENNHLITLKKQTSKISISPSKILFGKDKRTTIMIKNLPNIFTKQTIIDWISSICKVNYIYIPMRNNSDKILGFAFINVNHYHDILNIYNELQHKTYLINKFNLKKIEICYSNIQGMNSLIKAYGKEFVIEV